MIYVRTDPPGEYPVELADLKAHLRREPDDTAEDTILEAYLAAAIEELDGAGGVLHRCLVTQEWEGFADGPEPIAAHLPAHGFSSWRSCPYGPLGFLIDLGPVQTDLPLTVSCRSGGTWMDVSPATFVVLPDRAGRVVLALAPGAGWPIADRVPRAWRVGFTAGYGGDPEDVPAPIRAAILLMASDLDNSRDGKVVANMVANPTVDRLLAPYRMVTV